MLSIDYWFDCLSHIWKFPGKTRQMADLKIVENGVIQDKVLVYVYFSKVVILKTFMFGTDWLSSFLSQCKNTWCYIWWVISNKIDFRGEKLAKNMEYSFLHQKLKIRNINCIFGIEFVFHPVVFWLSINENILFVEPKNRLKIRSPVRSTGSTEPWLTLWDIDLDRENFLASVHTE